MPGIAASAPIFALFYLGGGEVILVLALMMILFGAKKLPGIGRGLGQGVSEFRKQLIGGIFKELDQAALDAGESLGGIYGKPAAQALTPDNQTAELYNPAVFSIQRRSKHLTLRHLGRLCRLVLRCAYRFFSSYFRALLRWQNDGDNRPEL
jgi:sec-independent protein translocase protein TatA